MKTLHIALLLILTAATATAGDAGKFVSKDGKFAIAFPRDVAVKTEKRDLEDGRLLNHVTVERQDIFYLVSYIDLYERELKDLKLFFDSVEDGFVRGSGARIIESKEIKFGKENLPGRNIFAEKDNVPSRLLIFVDGHRFYLIGIRGSKEYMESKEANAFFNSFELQKTPAPIIVSAETLAQAVQDDVNAAAKKYHLTELQIDGAVTKQSEYKGKVQTFQMDVKIKDRKTDKPVEFTIFFSLKDPLPKGDKRIEEFAVGKKVKVRGKSIAMGNGQVTLINCVIVRPTNKEDDKKKGAESVDDLRRIKLARAPAPCLQ